MQQHVYSTQTSSISDSKLDEFILASMGYEQQLARGIRNWIMSGAFCFVAIGTVPYVGIDLALHDGGRSTALATWIVTSVFSVVTVCALAEICSSFPNAGAMYHWTGQLAPKGWAPIVSYVTGVLLLVGNITSATTAASTAAYWIATIVGIQPGAEGLSSEATIGIAIALAIAWALFNVQRITTLAWFNVGFATFELALAVILGVTLFALRPPQGGATMWSEWTNGSGFAGVDGYVVLLGLSMAMYSLSAYDASTHLAEETLLAHSSVPVGMIAAVAASALTGFWVLVSLLYYVSPSVIALTSSTTDTPPPTLYFGVFASILANATGTQTGTTALAVLVAVGLVMTGSTSMTVATRIAFAMARDGALPFSPYLRYLPLWSECPIGSVGFVLALVIVFLLTALGSDRALNAIVLPYFSYLQLAYAIPLILRVTVSRNTFRRGPFHLGRFSVPVTWVAIIWLLGTSGIYFWPTMGPITMENMNWNVAAFGGFVFLAALWWFLWARRHFDGPRVRRGDIVTRHRGISKSSIVPMSNAIRSVSNTAACIPDEHLVELEPSDLPSEPSTAACNDAPALSAAKYSTIQLDSAT